LLQFCLCPLHGLSTTNTPSSPIKCWGRHVHSQHCGQVHQQLLIHIIHSLTNVVSVDLVANPFISQGKLIKRSVSYSFPPLQHQTKWKTQPVQYQTCLSKRILTHHTVLSKKFC
jgi:hypothetical protein